MDPIIGGALISGASSLLGGIFGKSKSEYVVPNYQKIRNKAEAAGFNPLTALAMAPGQVVQSQNFMGSAIADAGLALADGIVAKHKEQGALAKLAEENDKLREKVQNMTLRPKVPGVYAQREAIPSVSQAVGGSSGNASQVVSSGGVLGFGSLVGGPARPLLTTDPIDPRRKVDNTDVVTDPGFIRLDNPMLPSTPIPAVQGEILQLDQIPTVVGAMAADYGTGLGPRSRQIMDRAGWTKPGVNYWAKWGNDLKGMALPARDTKRRKPSDAPVSFWSTFGRSAY